MTNKINPVRAGFVGAAFLGAWHLAWALLVLMGAAQPLIDFIFYLHFIAPPYAMVDFDWGTAILLVVVTAIIGYLMGWFLVKCWNRIVR